MKLSERFSGKRLAPGLRVVKTGIAVTLCLCISYAAQLGQPIASAIAAAAVMGKSIDFSLRTARDGAVGAVLGAAAGCLFAAAPAGRVLRKAAGRACKTCPTAPCGGGDDTTIEVASPPPLWSPCHHNCGHPATIIVVTPPPQLWSPPHRHCGLRLPSTAACDRPPLW